MEASFKSDAKSVVKSAQSLEMALYNLKHKSSIEFSNSEQLKKTTRLIEKLSILNEYKLNLFKDFSSYNLQKK